MTLTAEQQIAEIIDSGQECEAERLTALFDALEPIEAEAMLGQWRGGAFETTSDAAGMLVKLGWYGKRFNDAEDVEPLLCKAEDGSLYSYDKLGKARLREVSFRGKASAAMVYDTQPIIDCFRRIDADRVLGLMDVKGTPPSFYFHLTRD
jgi:hypothetical protein